MKKIVSFVLFLVLISTFSVCAIASDDADYIYTYINDGIEYTVDFSGSSISQDKHELIARRLVGLDNDDVRTYGLMCTLFGHNYEESTISVVTHKVYKYAPRCEDKIYEVKICSRCDHQEQTLMMTNYIDCCPED